MDELPIDPDQSPHHPRMLEAAIRLKEANWKNNLTRLIVRNDQLKDLMFLPPNKPDTSDTTPKPQKSIIPKFKKFQFQPFNLGSLNQDPYILGIVRSPNLKTVLQALVDGNKNPKAEFSVTKSPNIHQVLEEENLQILFTAPDKKPDSPLTIYLSDSAQEALGETYKPHRSKHD